MGGKEKVVKPEINKIIKLALTYRNIKYYQDEHCIRSNVMHQDQMLL